MPEFRIVETTVSDKLAELMPLLEQHRLELEPWSPSVSPNLDAYRVLEQSGALLALVAYLDDQIIGYSINFLGPHMHYSGIRYCHNDMLFVDPERRAGKNGLALIRMTEEVAKERGASMVMWHAKPGTALANMLPRMGYMVQDTIFSKEL